MDNLDEMDRCLEKYKLPQLTQHETEKLNSLLTIKEIIKGPPKEKCPGPDSLIGELYQTFKEVTLNLQMSSRKEQEGTLHKFFYKVSITQVPKPDRDSTKKEERKKGRKERKEGGKDGRKKPIDQHTS